MATNYYNAQIGVVDASGNVNVIYPITKAANVDLVATSYSTVEACLAALGTAAFRNASDTYTATGSTVATTKAVYDAYSTLNSNKSGTSHTHNVWSFKTNTTASNFDTSSNCTFQKAVAFINTQLQLAYIILAIKSNTATNSSSTIYCYPKVAKFKEVSNGDYGFIIGNSSYNTSQIYTYYTNANASGGVGLYFTPLSSLSSGIWFQGEFFCAYDTNTLFI